jgi:TRAP-type mannitol/chloroaromatic compound transport system substrate-binding protein
MEMPGFLECSGIVIQNIRRLHRARVKVLTDGRLIITPYPGGAIVPTFEALDALQNNVIQAMHMWPGYFSGKEPAFAAISDMIAAYSHPWQKEAWMYYKGGMDMLREMYKPYNAYPVGFMFWGIETKASSTPAIGPHLR